MLTEKILTTLSESIYKLINTHLVDQCMKRAMHHIEASIESYPRFPQCTSNFRALKILIIVTFIYILHIFLMPRGNRVNSRDIKIGLKRAEKKMNETG